MRKAMSTPQVIPTNVGALQINEKDVEKYLVKPQPKNHIKIIFFGSDIWSIPVLQNLENNFEVAAVITAPNSPVSKYFRGSVLTPEKLNDTFSSELSTLNSELFIVASYGKIIPQSILDIPKFGALNVHPSLLPKYRGPSPVPTTILNGDKVSGVTIIKMDEKMDHGPVILTKEVNLSGQEDAQELLTKLFHLGGELLIDIIPDFIAGKLKLIPQKDEDSTYCKLLKKEDGFFSIETPPSPDVLDRMVRALNPWPGVWTKWDNKILKLLPNNLIQMEGKKPLSVTDFLNGYPNCPLKELVLTL